MADIQDPGATPEAMSIKKIGVIGAGQMGSGIAHVAAIAGIEVVMSDSSTRPSQISTRTWIARYSARRYRQWTSRMRWPCCRVPPNFPPLPIAIS
jgi:lactate dehydrogenase-like 2-hydroxyacid dehydrogenase